MGEWIPPTRHTDMYMHNSEDEQDVDEAEQIQEEEEEEVELIHVTPKSLGRRPQTTEYATPTPVMSVPLHDSKLKSIPNSDATW